MTLWQISCSGHHNSSLAILSCLCNRSYLIPVWSSLLLICKLLHSTLATQRHKVNTNSWSSLLSLCIICLHQPPVVDSNSSFNTFSQLTHRQNKLYHTINYDVSMGSPLLLFTFVICCQGIHIVCSFWQGVRKQGKPTVMETGIISHNDLWLESVYEINEGD